MRTCSRCQAQSPDEGTTLPGCGGDLAVYPASAVALARLWAAPRVGRIRVTAAADGCLACAAAEGNCDKANAPDAPARGCFNPHGCRCSHEPALKEIHPRRASIVSASLAAGTLASAAL